MKTQTCWCLVSPKGIIYHAYSGKSKISVMKDAVAGFVLPWSKIKQNGFSVRKIKMEVL